MFLIHVYTHNSWRCDFVVFWGFFSRVKANEHGWTLSFSVKVCVPAFLSKVVKCDGGCQSGVCHLRETHKVLTGVFLVL